MGKPLIRHITLEFFGLPSIGKTSVSNGFVDECIKNDVQCKNLYDDAISTTFIHRLLRVTLAVLEMGKHFRLYRYIHDLHICTFEKRRVAFSWDIYFFTLKRLYSKANKYHYSVMSQGLIQYIISLCIRNQNVDYCKLMDMVIDKDDNRLFVYIDGDLQIAYERMNNRIGFSYLEKDKSLNRISEMSNIKLWCERIMHRMRGNIIILDANRPIEENVCILYQKVANMN